jgi:ring-1,2-phenylacetyl-CoA epoxidase subunit PaaD
MAWLAEVPDPEIPALSLVDLGVIRGLAWEEGALVVSVAPTYSGCPATAVIEMSVERALRERGVPAVARRTISPPWTSDWITPGGRAKLERCGIAPPSPKGAERCPLCRSPRVEMVSRFGSTPCKAQWRCLSCGEPFDFFKCH